AGWPVLADPLSNVRCGARAVSTYDALLRDARFATAHRPQAALRLGAPVTSKATVRWLDGGVRQWMIDPDGTWLDPNRVVAEIAACDAEPMLDAVADALGSGRRRSAWLDDWLESDARARAAIDEVLDGWEDPFEGRIARDVVAGL